MVPMIGLEPILPQRETDFKSVVSTNSTTSAYCIFYHLWMIFATIKKQVIKLTKIIKVLKNRLICASFNDNIGMSGWSSSVFPMRWSTVLHQINQNFLNISIFKYTESFFIILNVPLFLNLFI